MGEGAGEGNRPSHPHIDSRASYTQAEQNVRQPGHRQFFKWSWKFPFRSESLVVSGLFASLVSFLINYFYPANLLFQQGVFEGLLYPSFCVRCWKFNKEQNWPGLLSSWGLPSNWVALLGGNKDLQRVPGEAAL